MPPKRKVVLKRWRRPGRKALLTFAGLFAVIRVEQIFAERSPANEVGRVVRASGSLASCSHRLGYVARALRAAPSWLVTVGKERCIFNRAVQILIITATDSWT